MKKILLLIVPVLLLHDGITLAQNIEITVLNKNSQPMPYAYIMVNGKPTSVSDQFGIAIISINKLTDKDTISVSYLGVPPAWTIYDESLKESKKHCFYLNESTYMLSDVVVSYKDIKKLFNKSTKKIPVLNYNCIMNANFDANLTFPDQKVYLASGTLEAFNELSRHQGWFHHPIKFITESDTIKTGILLNLYTHHALNFIYQALALCLQGSLEEYKPSYTYLGEKDNYNVFRISYPQNNYTGYPFQIILSVDKNTRYIHSVEFKAINTEANMNKHFIELSLKYDCEIFTLKKPKMDTVYLPVKIQYKAQTFNGLLVDIKLSDVSIK